MNAVVDSIESFGLVDGPGIRTVIFFSSCSLRCLYCHNPEMWEKKGTIFTKEWWSNIIWWRAFIANRFYNFFV